MPCIICGIWLGLSYGKSKCYLYAVRVRPPSQKLMTTNARMSTTCMAYRRAWHSLWLPAPYPALPCPALPPATGHSSICGSIPRCVFVCDKIFTCLQIERLELSSVCFACFMPRLRLLTSPTPIPIMHLLLLYPLHLACSNLFGQLCQLFPARQFN